MPKLPPARTLLASACLALAFGCVGSPIDDTPQVEHQDESLAASVINLGGGLLLAPNELRIHTCAGTYASSQDPVTLIAQTRRGNSWSSSEVELGAPGATANEWFSRRLAAYEFPVDVTVLESLVLRKKGNDAWCIDRVELLHDGYPVWWWDKDVVPDQYGSRYVGPTPSRGPIVLDDQREDAPTSSVRFADYLVYYDSISRTRPVELEVTTCAGTYTGTRDPVTVTFFHDSISETQTLGAPGEFPSIVKTFVLDEQGSHQLGSLKLAKVGNDAWCIDRVRLRVAGKTFFDRKGPFTIDDERTDASASSVSFNIGVNVDLPTITVSGPVGLPLQRAANWTGGQGSIDEACRSCSGGIWEQMYCNRCNADLACGALGKCQVAGGHGELCQEPSLLGASCDTGLSCTRGRCMEDGENGGPCRATASPCGAGLVCGAARICVDPLKTDERWYTSYQHCSPGDADCNPCAPNVKKQFDDSWDAKTMDWDNAQWSFHWNKNYAPSRREPDNVFGEHVQGFVRTYRDPIRFVGTYSADEGSNGGIFFINRRDDGYKYLSYLHSAQHRHPSGVSVLGKYAAFADKTDHIRLIDMDRVAESDPIIEFATNAHTNRAGGGLGLAKLEGDGYLLVVSPTGSNGIDDWFPRDANNGTYRVVRFFHLHGDLTNPDVTPVGVWEYRQPTSWSGDYRYTENLSVITECGTGDIYVVNTSGPEVDRLSPGTGWYLLSKVRQRGLDSRGKSLGLELIPLRAYHQEQQVTRCDQVAAATAWTDWNGNIDLMCSERASVNFWLDGDDDTLKFKYGNGK